MDQKFPIGTRVKLRNDDVEDTDHFAAGSEAIVVLSRYELMNDSTYRIENDKLRYKLLLLIPHLCYQNYWYSVNILELVCSNVEKGKQILSEYNDGVRNFRDFSKGLI